MGGTANRVIFGRSMRRVVRRTRATVGGRTGSKPVQVKGWGVSNSPRKSESRWGGGETNGGRVGQFESGSARTFGEGLNRKIGDEGTHKYTLVGMRKFEL